MRGRRRGRTSTAGAGQSDSREFRAGRGGPCKRYEAGVIVPGLITRLR